MEGRDLIRIATLDEYGKNPKFAQADKVENPLSLYPQLNTTAMPGAWRST